MAKSAFGDDFVEETQSPQGSVSAFGDSFVEEAKPQQAAPAPQAGAYDDLIKQASAKYGIDPRLLTAQIQQESGFNPKARSSAGARGLMQLMPATAAELGVTNPEDPAQNIDAGARYMRSLIDREGGNIDRALAAYNWGMGNLDKKGFENMPKETRDYIAKVRGNAGDSDVPMPGFVSQQNAPAPQAGPSTAENALLGAGRAALGVGQGFFNDISNAGTQVVSALIPDALERQLMVGGKTGIERVQEQEANYEQARQQMGAEPGSFDLSRMGGQMINPAMLATGAAGKVPGWIAKLGPKARAAMDATIRGIIGSELMPANTQTGDNFLLQKAGQGALGGAVGGAVGGTGELVKAGTGRIIGAVRDEVPQVMKDVRALSQKLGIPVTAGDVAPGNKFISGLTGMMENIRLPGAGISGVRESQQATSAAAAQKVVDAERNALNALTYRQLPDIEKIAAGNGKRAPEARAILQMIQDAGSDELKIIQASGNLGWLRHKIGADTRYAARDQAAAGRVVQADNAVPEMTRLMDKMSREGIDVAGDVGMLQRWQRQIADIPEPNEADAQAEAMRWATGQTAGEAPQVVAKDIPYEKLLALKTRIQSAVQEFTKDGTLQADKRWLRDLEGKVDDDLENFFSSDPKLKALHKRATDYYVNNVVPYQTPRLAKALSGDTPENIWNTFVNAKSAGKGDYAAKELYKALDNKGKQAVRYGIMKNALESAIEPRGFDPVKFMKGLDSAEYGVFFKDEAKKDAEDLARFFGHMSKVTPAHLSQYAPMIQSSGLLGMFGLGSAASAGSIPAAAAVVGGAYGMAGMAKWLLTTDAGQRILLASNALGKGGSSEQLGNLTTRALQGFSAQLGGQAGAATGLQGNVPASENPTNAPVRR